MSELKNIKVSINDHNHNAMVVYDCIDNDIKIMSLVVVDQKAVFPVPFLIEQERESIIDQILN